MVGCVTLSGLEKGGSQDPGQQQQKQEGPQCTCDTDHQALGLARGSERGAGVLSRQHQDSLWG